MALAYWTGVQTLPPARLFSSWVLRITATRWSMLGLGGRSKMGRENPL